MKGTMTQNRTTGVFSFFDFGGKHSDQTTMVVRTGQQWHANCRVNFCLLYSLDHVMKHGSGTDMDRWDSDSAVCSCLLKYR